MTEVTRLFDVVPYQLEKFPKADSLAGKDNGAWVTYSTQQFANRAKEIAMGLIALGINRGDKVVSISNNRPEWNMLDIGILQTGAVHVSIYPTISESEYKFILNDCEAKLIVVSDEALCKKLDSIKAEVPTLQNLYTFEKMLGKIHWLEIINAGKSSDESVWQMRMDAVMPTDLATLIYTSGTTGNPKGVMLSHSNLVSNFIACRDLPPVDSRHRALSFLPLCHVYERMLTYLYMYIGVSIYYAESMEKIGDNIREIKPHVFSAVPRLIEKVYDRIINKGKELTGVKRALFFWAVELGLKYEHGNRNGIVYQTKLKIADKLIFSKWREALGGNTMCIVSGGAALQERLARAFWAAGMPILEGYGLSETSPVIAVNLLGDNLACFGTVGTIIKGVDVKIADDGEILFKGPNLMMGYYKRDDLTKEVIDNEGWLHTGDIGTWVEEKFLKITDRKKEIFKTSGGKYIAPQPIENLMKESAFIENIMVIGESQKHASAIIVPNFAHVKSWCEIHKVTYTTPEEIIKNPQVRDRIMKDVEKVNAQLGHHERIKRSELITKEWTVVSGELTPTLKLKRKIIEQNNKDLIDKIYSVDDEK